MPFSRIKLGTNTVIHIYDYGKGKSTHLSVDIFSDENLTKPNASYNKLENYHNNKWVFEYLVKEGFIKKYPNTDDVFFWRANGKNFEVVDDDDYLDYE